MKTVKSKDNSIQSVHERLSKELSLRDIAGNNDLLMQGSQETKVSEIVTDSRRVVPDSAFFAIPGNRTDGNDYIGEALDRGAKTVITNKLNLDLPSEISAIYSDNPRLTLAKYAKRYHGAPDEHLNLIGVTGTNGKTTVTSLIRHLLEKPGRPVGLIGTVKYHLGDREVPSFRTTPEASDIYPLLRSMLVAGCSEAVMEVSSHGIHQSRVLE